jgi:hypothetical protein
MVKRISNKKGSFDIIMAFTVLFLSFIAMITATNILATFAMTPGILTPPIQGYYKADFGIYRAKWLLDKVATTGFDPAVSATINIDINSDGTTDVAVTVTRNAAKDFGIVSTSVLEGKTITAHYLNGALESIS